MALVRETELGRITISNDIFLDAITKACDLEDTRDKLWVALKPGISAVYGQDGRIDMEFSLVARFGEPIRELCEIACNYLAEAVETRSGSKPRTIKVNIVGVKSQNNNMAKRNMEVEFEY